MARLDVWLRDHPSKWVACLEFLVKVLNYLLAFAGLAMVAYAIDSYVHYHDLPTNSTITSEQEFHSRKLLEFTAYQNGTDPDPSRSSVPLNWVIIAFGAAGLLTALTAGTAILGASMKNLCCINTNVVLMSLLCAAQLCLAVAAFIFDHRGEEPPGSIEEFLHHKLIVFKWVWLAVAITELLTLLSNCLLQSAYTRASEVAEDREADQEWRARQPLLGHTQAAIATPEKNDEWSTRMRERYGLDTSQLTYDPEHTSQAAAAPRVIVVEQKRACSIM